MANNDLPGGPPPGFVRRVPPPAPPMPENVTPTIQENAPPSPTPNQWFPPTPMPVAPTNRPPQQGLGNMALNALKAWAEWRMKQVPTAEQVAQGNIPIGAGGLAGIVKGPAAAEFAMEAPELFKKLNADPRLVWAQISKYLPKGTSGENVVFKKAGDAIAQMIKAKTLPANRIMELANEGMPKDVSAIMQWKPNRVSDVARAMGEQGRVPTTIPHEALHVLYGFKPQAPLSSFPPAKYAASLYPRILSQAAKRGNLRSFKQPSNEENVIEQMAKNYVTKHGKAYLYE